MSIQQENLKAIADKIRELTGTSDKLVPSSFVDEVQNACDIKEAKGRTEGHDAGYSEGHTAGKTEGHDAGFTEGYTTGHSEGKEEAYAERPRFAKGSTLAGSGYLYITLDFTASAIGAFLAGENSTESKSVTTGSSYATTPYVTGFIFEGEEVAFQETNSYIHSGSEVAMISHYYKSITGSSFCPSVTVDEDTGETTYRFAPPSGLYFVPSATYTYFAYE